MSLDLQCFMWDVSELPEALPTHTLVKFHYLIHLLYPTNLHSFQEPVKHWTFHLRPLSLSHKTGLFSNLTLTNLILSLFLYLTFLFSSFVGSFAIILKTFPWHYILKEKKSDTASLGNYCLLNLNFICKFKNGSWRTDIVHLERLTFWPGPYQLLGILWQWFEAVKVC